MKCKIFQMTGTKRQILISCCMYLGQTLVGFTIAWSGTILPKLRDNKQSPLNELLSESQLSFVASFVYVGCIPGPHIIGWFSNFKGRKPCLLLGGVVAIIGYIILAITKNIAMLYCGRILTGIAVGIAIVMNVVYVGEIASPNVRGILLTILGVFHTSGAIVLYSAAHLLSYSGINYVGVVIGLSFTLAATLIPESPLFYILKGKDEAAIKTLQKLGRPEDIKTFLAAKNDVQNSNVKRDWVELFKLRSNRKALFIVIFANVFQHCSGVMAVIFFAGVIFAMSGSSIDSDTSMLIISAFQLLGSSISPFLVERNGKKILLITSTIICCLTMFLLGLYFYLDHVGNPTVENIKWFPLVILVFFFIGYDCGLGIIPNTLIGEMFTANVRSNGSAVTLTLTWVMGFLITTAFGAFVEIIGAHVAFWIFSGISCCSVFFVIFFVLETKGKSLLEIQEVLAK